MRTKPVAVGSWINLDSFVGNRAQLLNLDGIDPARIPGDPGNRKVTERYQLPDGRRVTINRQGKDSYRATIYCTDNETLSRKFHAAEAREMEAEAQRFAALPKSAEQYRRELVSNAKSALGFVLVEAQDDDGPYRLTPGSLDALKAGILEVLAAIEGATIQRNEADARAMQTSALVVQMAAAKARHSLKGQSAE